MGHGSRHRRSASGRRHGRTQDGRQVAPTTSPRRSGSRAARFIGATVALSLGAGVTAVMAGAADTASVPTSLRVAAVADTYVYQEYPGENRGAAAKLTASNQATLHTRSYLKFTVQGVPAGVAPTAHLLLSSDRNQPSAVDLHAVADTGWNEMSMTMRNAPAVGAVVATDRPASRQTSLDFDLSRVVTGNGTYSFALVDAQAGTVSAVFSREHGAGGPTLALDWSGTVGAPAPAPSPTASTAPTTAPPLPSMSPLPPSPTASTKPAPTSTASSPAPAPAPAPSGGTMFGTSLWQGDGSTIAQALTRETTKVGQLDIIRTYYGGMPAAWPGSAGVSGGPVVVSFKAAPSDVTSGRLDSQFANWFKTAPRDRPIYWSYFHEPENDIESGAFTTAAYRAAWVHLAGLADRANNPQLRSNLILMCWTLQTGSHRNWQDYFAGASVIDTIGWDCYNQAYAKGSYTDPASMLGKAASTSKAAGVNWAIAELGSKMASGDNGTGRAAWLTAIGKYTRTNGAAYVAYYDSAVNGEFRLLDAPSQTAWRQVIAG
jgi:hypothetical protein